MTPNNRWSGRRPAVLVSFFSIRSSGIIRAAAHLFRYAETEYIRKALSIMKTSRIVLALIAVSSLLLAGCCSVHHAGRWEYKVTQVPGAPQETANMRGPSLETREKYLNSLGNDGWILVSEDLGVFYLKRPKK